MRVWLLTKSMRSTSFYSNARITDGLLDRFAAAVDNIVYLAFKFSTA